MKVSRFQQISEARWVASKRRTHQLKIGLSLGTITLVARENRKFQQVEHSHRTPRRRGVIVKILHPGNQLLMVLARQIESASGFIPKLFQHNVIECHRPIEPGPLTSDFIKSNQTFNKV